MDKLIDKIISSLLAIALVIITLPGNVLALRPVATQLTAQQVMGNKSGESKKIADRLNLEDVLKEENIYGMPFHTGKEHIEFTLWMERNPDIFSDKPNLLLLDAHDDLGGFVKTFLGDTKKATSYNWVSKKRDSFSKAYWYVSPLMIRYVMKVKGISEQDAIAQLKRFYEPEIIIITSPHDLHQIVGPTVITIDLDFYDCTFPAAMGMPGWYGTLDESEVLDVTTAFSNGLLENNLEIIGIDLTLTMEALPQEKALALYRIVKREFVKMALKRTKNAGPFTAPFAVSKQSSAGVKNFVTNVKGGPDIIVSWNVLQKTEKEGRAYVMCRIIDAAAKKLIGRVSFSIEGDVLHIVNYFPVGGGMAMDMHRGQGISSTFLFWLAHFAAANQISTIYIKSRAIMNTHVFKYYFAESVRLGKSHYSISESSSWRDLHDVENKEGFFSNSFFGGQILLRSRKGAVPLAYLELEKSANAHGQYEVVDVENNYNRLVRHAREDGLLEPEISNWELVNKLQPGVFVTIEKGQVFIEGENVGEITHLLGTKSFELKGCPRIPDALAVLSREFLNRESASLILSSHRGTSGLKSEIQQNMEGIIAVKQPTTLPITTVAMSPFDKHHVTIAIKQAA